MKIAVASQNRRTISGHAGKVSRFYIYTINDKTKDIVDRELLSLSKEDILHNRFHESNNPWAPHPIFDVDLVITGGAGPGFINRLAIQSTEVIITSENDPDAAIRMFFSGSLPLLKAEHRH